MIFDLQLKFEQHIAYTTGSQTVDREPI